ncbi:hypothetical protein BHQ19_02725 [Mycolicibacterium porcinum]|nr:hypothetical protein BHQ19_02725 [Mycolicibacterium porcinum]
MLHGWLPAMFDNIDPWCSDTDIPAGSTWFGEIRERLDSSAYGIIVITTENVDKPWLNFEAGSLSKKLNEDKQRVTPLLVNFEQVNQLTGHPLAQYNAVLLNKDGMKRLCESIALSAGRNNANVALRFDQMWGQLEAQIAEAKSSVGPQLAPPEVSEPERLDVLTTSIRSLEATVANLVRIAEIQSARAVWSPELGSRIREEVKEAVSRYREVRSVSGSVTDTDADLIVTVVGQKMSAQAFGTLQSEIVKRVPIPVRLQIDYVTELSSARRMGPV